MERRIGRYAIGACFAAAAACPVQAEGPMPSEITVRASRTANTQPAGTFASVATALRYDPLIELQARGMPEGQADVTIRGGIFENTGFRLGAVTLMDPQTGHYTVGAPLDPASLSAPTRLTDIDNALGGFNATTGTIHYGLAPVSRGGVAAVGVGSDALRMHSLRGAVTRRGARGGITGAALSAASSVGDGSQPGGDHDFRRYNVHLQHRDGDRQSDLILAYDDKFHAWPGAYTGFADFAEADHSKTTLLFANHRRDLAQGWIEVGAYHRRLEDDYDFDRSTRESGAPGAFEHETAVQALGFQGLHRGERIDWRYGGQLTADRLVSSTDLTQGNFERRRYYKLTILPSVGLGAAGQGQVRLRFGATLDGSNRDSDVLSPLIGVAYRRGSNGRALHLMLEYAQTSQVPGYTALASPPSGLFGGNAELGREKARQLMAAAALEGPDGELRATLFHRRDDGLVDWTYTEGAPFARQANPLDGDVTGLELFLRRTWADFGIAAGYVLMDKDVDYGGAFVDASFYALNFARHRATVAATWRMTERFEWRLDSEYRLQEENLLRRGGAAAVHVSLGLAWQAADGQGPAVMLTADNLTDEDYQHFPGTPAVGRQLSLVLRYAW